MFMHATACRGLYRHRMSLKLEVDWEKIPLLHHGLKPVLVLHLDFQSNALPTELSPLCLPVLAVV